MPAVLQQLMRHESIDTTLKYYAGRNAQATTAALYEAVAGHSKVTHGPESDTPSVDQLSQLMLDTELIR
jgi:hypothetical protein